MLFKSLAVIALSYCGCPTLSKGDCLCFCLFTCPGTRDALQLWPAGDSHAALFPPYNKPRHLHPPQLHQSEESRLGTRRTGGGDKVSVMRRQSRMKRHITGRKSKEEIAHSETQETACRFCYPRVSTRYFCRYDFFSAGETPRCSIQVHDISAVLFSPNIHTNNLEKEDRPGNELRQTTKPFFTPRPCSCIHVSTQTTCTSALLNHTRTCVSTSPSLHGQK